jgi:hypothetical protein
MKWIAALALAASLLAGCDQKAKSPAPAAGPQAAPAPAGGAQPAAQAPAAPAPAGGAQPAAPEPAASAPSPGRGQFPERLPSGGPAAQAPTGPEVTSAETIRLLIGVADKVCACKDRACAEAAYVALQEENKKLAGRPRAKPTQAEADTMQAQAARLSGCIKQLP